MTDNQVGILLAYLRLILQSQIGKEAEKEVFKAMLREFTIETTVR